ncbi:MAG TPA: hypothetical protein VK435_06005 [Thermodesulfovibrionales bacterium]|nr:hypothetical protein [Thermodesulfovibrionales bacterium]
MIETNTYTKLPGRGLKKGGTALIVRTRARLYMGKNHLLCVYNTGYTEDYKRFYYKDIQALVTCRTSRGKTLNIVFGALTAFHVLVTMLIGSPWNIISSSIAGLFLLLLLANIFRGPTSKAYLLTAVTMEDLPSLCRMKNALKVLELLRPVIEAAQGKLSKEDIQSRSSEIRMREMPDKAPAGTRPVRRAAPSSDSKPASSYNGTFHMVLFMLLLLCSAYSAVDVYVNHIAVTYAGIAIGSAAVIFAILSAVRQYGSAMPGGIIGLTWSALFYLLFESVILYGIYIFTGIMHPDALRSRGKLLMLYSSLDPFENMFLMGALIFSAVFYFIAGSAGLILLRKFRSSIRGV